MSGEPMSGSGLRYRNWATIILTALLFVWSVYPPRLTAGEAAPGGAATQEKERLAKERQQMIRDNPSGTERSPEVVSICLVAPDVLALTIQARRIERATLQKYLPQADDVKEEEKWKDGTMKRAKLLRKGRQLGWLQGRTLDWLTTLEKLTGDPLLVFLAEEPGNYTLRSSDDPNFSAGVRPVAVYRKSIANDWLLPWGDAMPVRHTLYLKSAAPFRNGKTYQINVDNVNLRVLNLTFKADLENTRSDAVHVNQIGYRPHDPLKQAFLSLWMGTGGACEYPAGMKFFLVRESDGSKAYRGEVRKVLAVDGKETLWTKPPKNYNQTAVYCMEFSDFTIPGKYRVYVQGLGCSYPFAIDDNVWEHAFQIQMKGLYNNRSGVELGPPYTDFRKPRDLHPDDGAQITRTTCDVLLTGDFAYDDIVKGDTNEPVKNAWGGYHDAGDWNPRRVFHMKTTLAQLEMAELFPDYFNKLNLNIPATPGIPDIITEALFEIDCFRRMQQADGGIPFGIESDGDPGPGELSWLTTQRMYVVAPNMRDSWFYAAVAARAAKVLRPIKPLLAKEYEDSASRAFDWAEKDYQRRSDGRQLDKVQDLWQAIDARNLAALILYDLSGNKKYHEIFMASSLLKKDPDADLYAWGGGIQDDAVFLYARMDTENVDTEFQKLARASIIKLGDRSLDYGKGNAFGLTHTERGRPMFAGFFSTSGGTELTRAHYLSGDVKYLKGALQSCQFQSGCNPNNIVYTTGLGANPVRNPLHLDARSSGQATPVGLTVFGNVDYWNWKGGFWDWPIGSTFNKPENCWPNPYDWPLTEAYFDVFLFVSMNEFVIDTWAPNIYVWGYLSAAPAVKPNE